MLNVLTFLVQILTMVINLVKEFEVPGFGEQKRQAVLDSVALAYDAVSNVVKVKISKEKVLEFASAAIEIIVGFYNLTGVFKKESTLESSF